jgi:tRNA pseudouridine55 synthase
MVSAVKVGGERLYRLARRGVVVERPARPVVVHEWSWREFDFPRARFVVRCSGGTYVRTLAHDLGQRLGCGAVLEELRRTASAPFDLERSVTAADLEALTPAEILARGGIPLEGALAHLPRIDLDPAGAEAFGHGRPIPVPDSAPVPGAAPRGPRSVAFFGAAGAVLGLGELRSGPDGPVFAVPRVVLASASADPERTVAEERLH